MIKLILHLRNLDREDSGLQRTATRLETDLNCSELAVTFRTVQSYLRVSLTLAFQPECPAQVTVLSWSSVVLLFKRL